MTDRSLWIVVAIPWSVLRDLDPGHIHDNRSLVVVGYVEIRIHHTTGVCDRIRDARHGFSGSRMQRETLDSGQSQQTVLSRFGCMQRFGRVWFHEDQTTRGA